MKFILKSKKGSSRGKNLGFPTLNFSLAPSQRAGLSFGIYRGFVSFAGSGPFPSAIYFGKREMFGESEPILEAHLLEGAKELPNVTVGCAFEVEVIEKIRAARAFKSEEDLKKAMEKDIETISGLFYT